VFFCIGGPLDIVSSSTKMVELKLEPLDGNLTKDYYVSVRVGEVQKLSRINAGRGYKFPSSAIGERKFGKIEIFKKVGHASVGIVPENGVDQEVRVDLEDETKVRFKVALNTDEEKSASRPVRMEATQEKSPGRKQDHSKVQAAKAYLEQHNLEMRLSEAMQAVLREKPEDPAAFVAEKLAKSAGAVQKTPSSPKKEQPVPTAKVLPFNAYYNYSMRQMTPAAFGGIYSAFPAYNSAPAPPPPPAPLAPAPAASSSPAKASDPAKGWVVLTASEQRPPPEPVVSLPVVTTVSSGDDWLLNSGRQRQSKPRWDTKPSVGTWCSPRAPTTSEPQPVQEKSSNLRREEAPTVAANRPVLNTPTSLRWDAKPSVGTWLNRLPRRGSVKRR